MTIQKLGKYTVITFIASLLLLSYPSPRAQAAIISQQQVKEQEIAVKIKLVETLQEHVKLLQMIFIQNLEARIQYLENLLASR